MAGYSDTPLLKKLGYEPHDSIRTFDCPEWLVQLLSAHGINTQTSLPATWVHGFFKNRDELSGFLSKLDFNGIEKGLWVSWPKKSSYVATDLTEQGFRDTILPLGWVDTKVCAIDDIWSGLKFVRRTA